MAGRDEATVEVPLGLGIQTDVDDKLLPVGKVVQLENAIWERGGEILKRNGLASLNSQYAANTSGIMPKAWQLATHKGALVSLSTAGPRPLGVYSPSVSKWVAPAGSTALDNINGVSSKLRGQILPRRTTVYRANSAGDSSRLVFNPDVATNGTYAAVAWLETNGGAGLVKIYFIELATGKKLFEYSQSLSGTVSCRVAFVNGEFDLIYITGTNLRARTWSVTGIAAGGSGWQVSGEFTLATDNNGAVLDTIVKGTDLYCLYNNATNPRIAKATGGVSSGTFTLNTLTDSGGGALNAGQLAWMRDNAGSGKLAAAVGSGAQGVRVQWDITGGLPVSSYTIDGAAGQPAFLAASTTSSAATGEFVVLWELPAPNQAIRWGRRLVASGISSATWILSAGLASTIWRYQDGSLYAMTRYDSTTQGSLFVSRVPTSMGDATDTTRTPSARLCTGQMVTLSNAAYALPTVTQLSTDVFLSGVNVKVRLVVGSTVSFDTGADLVTLTYNPANVNSPREFADNLYVCGGVLGSFDGVTFAEAGFHLFPEITQVTQQVAGSLTLTGNYQWSAVYRYTDNYGRISRSTPSEPIAATLTGSNRGALVAVKTLKFHGRPCRSNDGGRAGSVVIELYRVSNNELDDMALVAVVDNDESVDTLTITDTTGDTSRGEDLYTNGNVLPNDAPPPALALVPYKDRLAVISAEDPTLVWVSLPLSPTEGPRFSDVSTFRIDDSRGDLTALAASDDRLIQFKRDAIYTISGDGVDAEGNGTFGLALLVASGVGCVEPRSIVETMDGVIFRPVSTRDGLMMLNRGLALDPVGKEVQAAFASTVTVADAVHIPSKLRTKVYLGSGTIVVYDHMLKLWSTDVSSQAPIAATVWGNGPAYQAAASDMVVLVEDTTDTVFADLGSSYDMYVESPWMSLAKLKGYLRFKRVQLVGDKRYTDPGEAGYKITVSFFKDFDASAAFHSETRELLVTDDINAVETRYSAKVSALKVGIRISQKSGASANFKGPKLTALVIVYSLKQGLRKTASTNRTT